MFRRQGRRALPGVALILGLTALGLFIFYLDAIQRALQPTYRLYALLPDAPRVRPGTPVTIAGVAAGRVTRIGLAPVNSDSAAKAVLTLELETGTGQQVRRDSDIRLRRERFVGDPVVDILPGSPAAAVLAPGDTLRARMRPRPADALVRARELSAAFDSLHRATRGLALAWSATRPAAMEASRRTAAARAELRILGDAYRTGPLAAWLAENDWRSALDRTRVTAAQLRILLRGRTAPSLAGAELARIAARADSLAAEFARLEAALAAPSGLPGRFSRDPALARALRAARAELDSLVAETRRNPLRFLF